MQTAIGMRFLADEPHFYVKSNCRSSKKVTQIGSCLTCSGCGKIANIVTQRKKIPSCVFLSALIRHKGKKCNEKATLSLHQRVVSSDQGEWEKNTSDKNLAQLIKLLIPSIFSLLYFCSVSFQGRFNYQPSRRPRLILLTVSATI